MSEKDLKFFWRPELADVICITCGVCATTLVWGATCYKYGIDNVFLYWDGPNYLYVAKTLYKIPKRNPWTVLFNFPQSYFACHLPLYPLLIKFCTIFTLGNYKPAFYVSIIVETIIFMYLFRRLLISYNASSNPTFICSVLAFFPVRFLLYHSVGATEPLYISTISLALIFYKRNSYWKMLIAVWLCCITRIEGMAMGFTIGLCYLLRLEIVKAAGMFLTFIAPAALVGVHYLRFGDALAYIHYNKDKEGIITWPPFREIIYSFDDKTYVYSFFAYYILNSVMTALTYEQSVPVAIYCTVHMIYVSMLWHIDVFRYMLPVTIFSISFGLRRIIEDHYTKKTLFVLLPLYLIFALVYCREQIHSNIADRRFTEYTL